MTALERQSVLIGSLVLMLFCFWQPGKLLAGDSLESGSFIMDMLTPVIGLVGAFTGFLTCPLMFIAIPLAQVVGDAPAFSIVYGVAGIYILSVGWFKNIIGANTTSHPVIAYLFAYLPFDFLFDYSWRIQNNLIAAGQAQSGLFDNMWIAMYFSFSVLMALIVTVIYCGIYNSQQRKHMHYDR